MSKKDKPALILFKRPVRVSGGISYIRVGRYQPPFSDQAYEINLNGFRNVLHVGCQVFTLRELSFRNRPQFHRATLNRYGVTTVMWRYLSVAMRKYLKEHKLDKFERQF